MPLNTPVEQVASASRDMIQALLKFHDRIETQILQNCALSSTSQGYYIIEATLSQKSMPRWAYKDTGTGFFDGKS